MAQKIPVQREPVSVFGEDLALSSEIKKLASLESSPQKRSALLELESSEIEM